MTGFQPPQVLHNRCKIFIDVSNKVPGNPYAILDCVDGSGSIANECEQQGSASILDCNWTERQFAPVPLSFLEFCRGLCYNRHTVRKNRITAADTQAFLRQKNRLNLY